MFFILKYNFYYFQLKIHVGVFFSFQIYKFRASSNALIHIILLFLFSLLVVNAFFTVN